MKRLAWSLGLLGGCLLVVGGAADGAVETLWWPHWRGPEFNGVVAEGAPPLRWDARTNIAWVQPVPGQGGATPIVVGNRLIVLSAEKTDREAEVVPEKHPDARTEPPRHFYRFWLTALHRETGRLLWRRLVTEALPHEGQHRTNTYAGGSPVSDGLRIYFSLGSRGVYAYTLDGERLWRKDLGTLRTRRGWGEASPLAIHEEALIVPWDQEDQSRVVSLDAGTGQVRWEVMRDEPSNWSTPVIVPERSGVQVVLNGTHRARGYALDSGEPVWAVGTLSVNAIPTPVFDDALIFCMSGYQKSILYAVPRGSEGDLTGSDSVAWTFEKHTPYVASPLLYGGFLYLTKGLGNRISILNPRTGEALVEAEPIRGLSNVYASPIGVNGHVYIVDREGNTAVLRAGSRLEVVSVNRLQDTVDASPLVVGDRLYLRSWSAVYCIAKSP